MAVLWSGVRWRVGAAPSWGRVAVVGGGVYPAVSLGFMRWAASWLAVMLSRLVCFPVAQGTSWVSTKDLC